MDGLSASTAGVPRGRRPLESGDESASKRIKREKAAERQRRKRERDRTAAVEAMMSYSAPPNPNHHHHHHHHIPGQQPGGQAASSSAGTTTTGPPGQLQSASFAPQTGGHDLAAEVARRERVRAAARERQRKHRQLVKERKLRAMGIDLDEMVPSHHPPPPSGGGGGSADGNNGHGPFHHVLPPEMQGHASHGAPPPPHPPPPPDAFPHALGQLSGGRLFASTILLSFSCDPLLKVNLMRTLGMTHDELASLEPVIAEAWEHWDHQRRLHGAAANGSSGVTGGAPNGPHPFTSPPPTNGDPTHNEFRTRFRNSIEVPPPFAAYAHSAAANPPVQTPSTHGGGGGGPSEDSIDPELADQSRPAAAGTGANDGKTAAGGVGGVPKAGAPSSSSSNNKTGVPTIDPNLALKKES